MAGATAGGKHVPTDTQPIAAEPPGDPATGVRPVGVTEVAQIQSQISALSSMMTQMQSMLSGREGTEGDEERPLAQRRPRRTNAGAALCNFVVSFLV